MARKPATSGSDNMELIPIEKLVFDEENPRLVEIGEFKGLSEDKKTVILWEDMAAEEIANSIAQHGYFDHEPMFAEQHEDKSKYTVIEGNRRLAAVKVLLSPDLRKRVRPESLKAPSAALKRDLQQLPVILTTRKGIWHYVGFKHVNGPRPWGPYSKAEYIARVHNDFGVPLEDISRQIGDGHLTVKRLYRGLMALQQAEENGVFDRNDRWSKRFSFSHLYTGLGSKGIQTFLSITEATSCKRNPIPKRNIENLGELCVWLYGSKSKEKQPLIRSQNPDLNSLAEALQTERGTYALRAGLPLQVAVDAGRGDERLLQEAMARAKHSLQTAVGMARTGYDGKNGLIQLAEEIYSLSGKLLDDMEDMRKPKKRTRGRPSR